MGHPVTMVVSCPFRTPDSILAPSVARRRDWKDKLAVLVQMLKSAERLRDEGTTERVDAGDASSQTRPSSATARSTTSALRTSSIPSFEQVIMSAAMSVPSHRLREFPDSRAIEIGPWTVTARTNPISNSGRCDALQAAIGGIPLPEMTFGNNSLELDHRESGWRYAFTTEEALKGVRNGELQEGDGGVKVGYAEAWMKSR